MFDKFFSILKGVAELVTRGGLTGVERIVHFGLQCEAESALNEFAWMRGE
jgi:hypothetical protein